MFSDAQMKLRVHGDVFRRPDEAQPDLWLLVRGEAKQVRPVRLDQGTAAPPNPAEGVDRPLSQKRRRAFQKGRDSGERALHGQRVSQPHLPQQPERLCPDLFRVMGEKRRHKRNALFPLRFVLRQLAQLFIELRFVHCIPPQVPLLFTRYRRPFHPLAKPRFVGSILSCSITGICQSRFISPSRSAADVIIASTSAPQISSPSASIFLTS